MFWGLGGQNDEPPPPGVVGGWAPRPGGPEAPPRTRSVKKKKQPGFDVCRLSVIIFFGWMCGYQTPI